MFKSFFIIFCLIIALSAWALSAKVPPINSTWVEGHWVTVESQKVWVPGYWKDPNEKPEKQLESEKDPVKENKVIYIQQPVVQETKVVYVQQPTQQVIYVQQPQSTFMSFNM